jgi:ferredoxin-NADP reductase
MSMLREEERQGSRRPRLLLCANRSPADAPFLAELHRLARPGTGLRMVSALTANAPAPGTWGGIADPELLRRELGEVAGAMHYLAGPPGMVAALRNALGALGVEAAAIRTDEFYGY